MQDRKDRIIQGVYREWKNSHLVSGGHLDENEFACLLENKLPKEDSMRIKKHILSCNVCAEKLALQIKLGNVVDEEVPLELMDKVKQAVYKNIGVYVLEILLKLKDNIFEVLNVTGDIVVGQELLPAAVLRSRNISNFKDEIIIFKDFKDIRAEIKIENKAGKAFDLTAIIKKKDTQEVLKDLRISLFREGAELESLLTESGKVTFSHISYGNYVVEIVSLSEKVASIVIDIKQ